MGENVEVITAAVGALVGVVCSREQEEGGVIGSWQGVVLRCSGGGEGELEETALVLWLDGARDAKI